MDGPANAKKEFIPLMRKIGDEAAVLAPVAGPV